MRRSHLLVQARRGLMALVSLSAFAAPSRAQSGEGPVFLLQPGLLSADFLSGPEGVPSTTGFNIRFATRFSTGFAWINPIVGGSVTPWGTSGSSVHNTNAPALFAGNVFPVLSAGRTGGWVTLEVPLLVYHSYGGGGTHNPRVYGRDAYVQLAGYVHLGAKMLHGLGANWDRLDAYAFLEQSLTPNEDGVSGHTDRFNPVAIFGLSLSFGGRRE